MRIKTTEKAGLKQTGGEEPWERAVVVTVAGSTVVEFGLEAADERR
jgi:hypothetical protein